MDSGQLARGRPGEAEATHAVIQQAKDAGVYVFSGGLDEDIEPVGDVPSRGGGVAVATKVAVACRCGQEVREVMFDPLV